MSCSLASAGDPTNTNPLLGLFQNNGGDNVGCPTDDQRGATRPFGIACDIGAVESPFKTPQKVFLPLVIR